MKKSLITGIAGQDGSYLAELLLADQPDDYVVASGETHSVREFVAAVFSRLELNYVQYVKVDPSFFRPRRRCSCAVTRRKQLNDSVGRGPSLSNG